MKISLCAESMHNNDVPYQIRIIERCMKEDTNSDFLFFGEAFLQGFDSLSWDYEQDFQRALSLENSEIIYLRELTRSLHHGLGFGFIERDGEALYSSYLILDRYGKTVDQFRRISKGWKEPIAGPQYKEGPCFHTFDLNGYKAATAICGDLWYEQNIAAMQALKAELILWPLYLDYSIAAWEGGEKAAYTAQVASLNCPVLMVNSYMDDPDLANGGAVVFNSGRIEQEVPMGEPSRLSVEFARCKTEREFGFSKVRRTDPE